ncbi:hypothetical protein [Alkaliphilus crotonatoxidans]
MLAFTLLNGISLNGIFISGPKGISSQGEICPKLNIRFNKGK